MKLTATVKLLPTSEQWQTILHTLERANFACNSISEQAKSHKTFNRVGLHHLSYYTVREQLGLSAQMAVRCIGKVSDAYKLDKKTLRVFEPHGAIAYDSRILKWHLKDQCVSIWTLGGRIKISFACGEHQKSFLPYQKGESDLMYRKGEFYLSTTCDIPDEAPIVPVGYLGVDMGIANIATDSDGERRPGKKVNRVRHRNQRLRQKLQKKGTKSAKRLLKKRSGRESRFVKDVNHCISKALVQKAQRTGRGIAIEDLTGIRERVRLRKHNCIAGRSTIWASRLRTKRKCVVWQSRKLILVIPVVNVLNVVISTKPIVPIKLLFYAHRADFRCTPM